METSHGLLCEADIFGGHADIMVLLMPLARNGMLPIKKLETVATNVDVFQ